ncbi:Wadjet anti-phage system protein JetD domain-containing protein [Undibacterium sp.]|uniref:Wadjet anti-phage system protein JetD domain-containing protein n=1 Tax=Undibacterium sp. TaxID=1914977 RepID=UPI003750F7A8
MNWSTEKSLKEQVLRWWEQGDLLRASLPLQENTPNESACLFPCRLSLKVPNSNELADRFEEVRLWIAKLTSIKGLRIEWRELNHRVLGKQKIPQAVWLDSLNDALAFIGKQRDTTQFVDIANQTCNAHPELLAWLQKRPMLALSLHHEWSRLLAIITWVKQHPQPGIYLRQIDIPGVHSKFIETHRRVLSELLDLVLPPEAIHQVYTGIKQFSARYGFLEKPQHIRFRSLDTRLNFITATTGADLSLDSHNFGKLNLPPTRVFITENETNFLAFPQVENALIIFGAGYGWDALAQANWLHRCDIYYWGDIDTHGFAILNQLRHRFPHVRSFLMDEGTLLAHQNLWGREEQTINHTLPLLSEEEAQLFKHLQNHILQEHLRLEQEHIRFSVLKEALAVIDL